MKQTLIISIAVVLLVSGLTFAGNLEPPSSPNPTMKTLDEVEPRIPIDSLPYTIIQRGSYYLTKNLLYSGTGTAITVNERPVKIDLMGYTIEGTRTSDTFGIKSIHGDTEIINGNVERFGTGIQSDVATMRVINVMIVDNLEAGISFPGGIIKNSVIRNNGTYGINGPANMIIGNRISGHTIGIETDFSLIDQNYMITNDNNINPSPCGNCVFGVNYMP